MPELGNKFECFSCGAKFYDLGKPEPICPKCGANQRDARKQEASVESIQVKKRRREEVVRVEEPEEDLLAPSSGDEDFADEEIETPEGVGEDDAAVDDKDDLDDDE